MQRRVIIHVGLPKCGSSGLQFILASNRARLATVGIDYPNITAESPPRVTRDPAALPSLGQTRLAGSLVEASRPSAAAPCTLLGEIVAQFERRGDHTLILSSESFMMRAPRLRRSAIGDLFEGYDVCIMLFVRRHDIWVTSSYRQAVKAPGRRFGATLDHFLAAPPAYASDIADFDICARAIGLQQIFGDAALHLFDLDAATQDTVALLGRLIDLPIETWPGDPAILKPYNAALHARGLPINRSLADAATLFLAQVNAIAGEDVIPAPVFQHLIVALAAITLPPSIADLRLLSRPLSIALLASASEQRQRLARHFGVVSLALDPEPVAVGTDHRQRLDRSELRAIAERVTATLDAEATAVLEPIFAQAGAAGVDR